MQIRRLSLVRVALLLALSAGIVSPVLPVDIPRLDWVECSDWTNVKTDITPAAKGDGIADDAPAIQRTLDSAVDRYGNPRYVVYIPAGRYRITKTLRMPSSVGLMIIGNGRDTKIEWDGPNMKSTNLPHAAHFVSRQNRRGWTL